MPLRPVEFEILVTLSVGPAHGYGILQAAEARRGAGLGMTTLYRALRRLADEGWIRPLDPRPDDERRTVYELTPEGRRAARDEAGRLHSLLDVAARGALLGDDR